MSQWDLKPHKNKLSELFRSETYLNSVSTHNANKDNKRVHEGGKGILEFDRIEVWVLELETDSTGLGRWFWIKLKVKNIHVQRIVCAYQTCGNPATEPIGIGTIYDQQIRYHISIRVTCRPRILFREEIVLEIEWKRND